MGDYIEVGVAVVQTLDVEYHRTVRCYQNLIDIGILTFLKSEHFVSNLNAKRTEQFLQFPVPRNHKNTVGGTVPVKLSQSVHVLNQKAQVVDLGITFSHV